MMKRILLTGATGFVGSFLLKQLIGEGHEVIVLKRSFSNIHRISDELQKVKSYDIDLISIDSIFQKNKGIDLIIHTATNYGRDKTPLSIILNDNVIFPVILAETGIRYGCNAFINTDSFFGKGNLNYEYLAHYTVSKKISVEALRATGIKLINCRLEHVYGPGDDNKKFVTSMITQLLADKPSIDLTDGKQKRDFVFVGDVVNAFSTVISHIDDLPKFAEVEVGTCNAISIFDFVNAIKKALPFSKTQLNWGTLPQRLGEFEESKADLTVLSKLGWKPVTALEEGILKTIKHHNTHGI